MVYLPTFTMKLNQTVGKYTRHGSVMGIENWEHHPCSLFKLIQGMIQIGCFKPESFVIHHGLGETYSWLVIQPTPPRVTYPLPRNKGLIAGLIKGNQWLISPDHKALFLGGLRGPGGVG